VKKLQVMFGVSVMVLMGGIAMLDNQQVKASSQSELLAEAAVPPSPPTGQRNPPGYGGGGGSAGSGSDGGIKPGPRTIQPRIPKT
jgi:hypothetical protein